MTNVLTSLEHCEGQNDGGDRKAAHEWSEKLHVFCRCVMLLCAERCPLKPQGWFGLSSVQGLLF